MTDEEKFQQCITLLKDKQWRINNLYKILDKDKQEIAFVPNAAQIKYLEEASDLDVILKARQLGFSSAIQICEILDSMLFKDNFQALIIANTQRNAKNIMRDKLVYAYDRLPPIIKAMRPLIKDTMEELILANGSSVTVSTSARGGTWSYTHISEFGNIARNSPDVARAILTATIPASKRIVVESTAEGADGEYADLVTKARSGCEWKFHFYAWHDNVEYQMHDDGRSLQKEDTDYFAKIEASASKTLSREQRIWYITTRNRLPDPEAMRQEHPSTADEAFATSVNRCYYSTQYAKMEQDGRICSVPYDTTKVVDTWWDLGVSDSVAVWFSQEASGVERFIDYYEDTEQTVERLVDMLNKRGYTYGTHYLPHDGNQRKQGEKENLTPQQMFANLGVTNTVIVPRVATRLIGINATRMKLSMAIFDAVKCALGLSRIKQYRKKWNKTLGCAIDDEPEHDNSHGPDALRQWGQTKREAKHVNKHVKVRSAQIYGRR